MFKVKLVEGNDVKFFACEEFTFLHKVKAEALDKMGHDSNGHPHSAIRYVQHDGTVGTQMLNRGVMIFLIGTMDGRILDVLGPAI